ncbi:MAG: hypothetical protein Q9163_004432 [Psora crenata]
MFDAAYTKIMGFGPTEFLFVPRTTPLSTLSACATTLVTYYVTILGGREVMKGREPFKLNGLFMLHNLYLTLISGVLLALFIEQLVPTLWEHGVFYAICDQHGGWTRPLVTLYYLNYLTKYLELLDTVFMVLKKKPLTFLHTYHHGATALLCYTQLIGNTSVSWVPISLNLLVHVVMYWYYFQAARGVRIWWKKWVTRLQIIQFVIDLGFVYFASYTYFASTYFPRLPSAGSCAGEEFAAFAGMGILSSYLLLFVSFYLATYNKEKGQAKVGRGSNKARRVSLTATKATIDMARMEVPDAHHVGEKMHITGSDNNKASRSTHQPGSDNNEANRSTHQPGSDNNKANRSTYDPGSESYIVDSSSPPPGSDRLIMVTGFRKV